MMEEQRPRPTIGGGIRSGIGILSAFRDAIEETIQDAVDRNDLRPERAREAMGTALERMQGAFDEMRERVDVVPRKEFDALRAEVEELRRRVEQLSGGPTRFLPGDVGSPGVFGGGAAGGPEVP